ncbi:aminotransferase class I/II-fold pyridoxal phosphate-dependent enzyme [Flavobacteriaceae bacterium]|nr:aminotransferase class I/II-fold pyridoxal phosphate-dependent enzyme [Flavobacteriaceae bacterium]
MQTRRDWLRSSMGIGGLLLAPPTLLTAQQKRAFHPRTLEPVIRLSSNENPYGPSKRVQERIINSFVHGCRYPYAYSDDLASILAKKHRVDPESIIVTGGSTEGLKIAGLTFASHGGEIISGQPTFLAMMDYAKQWGATVNWVPVGADKGYDLDEIENRISPKTKLVFLCNPNNPTGTLVPAKKLVDFCNAASQKTIVFSDEAYYDFIETPNYPSMVEAVKRGDNVIVSKTFSKVYGMAGLRVGYLIAKPELAVQIRKNIVAMSNVLAVEAAKEALQDDAFYQFSLAKNKEAKNRIYTLLDHLKLEYVPSHTNFVFFHSKKDIRELGPKMLEKGVRIGRPFPPFYDWCRVSTGTLEEVDVFIKGMLEVYEG